MLYINDLPIGIKSTSESLLMAYDTSVLITGNNSVDLQMRSESVLNHKNKLFGTNDLALNTDKINVIQFNLNYIQEDESKVSTKLKKK
jgi:hypothetical protein